MRLVLLTVIAACGAAHESDALARRRIAMGLPDAPMPLKEAMAELERRGSLDWLRTGGGEGVGGAGGGRRGGGEGVEEAIRIENLLDRAQPAEPSYARFEVLLDLARAYATELVRGAPGAREALLQSCIACHAEFREEPGAPR